MTAASDESAAAIETEIGDARAELGAIWKRLMGRHYPAMSMIFVSDLLDSPGKIELEATAVIPTQ